MLNKILHLFATTSLRLQIIPHCECTEGGWFKHWFYITKKIENNNIYKYGHILG